MVSAFVMTDRLAHVLRGDVARSIVKKELEMVIHLSLEVSWADIVGMFGADEDGTALWLDSECAIVVATPRRRLLRRHSRYTIELSGSESDYLELYFIQVPGITEHGAVLPALDYLLDRLLMQYSKHFCVGEYYITIRARKDYADDDSDLITTLPVSSACFLKLLQSGRTYPKDLPNHYIFCSVRLCDISLLSEQTKLFFAGATGPVNIELLCCAFDGPTLVHQGLMPVQPEETDVTGRESYVHIEFSAEQMQSISIAALVGLLSVRHVRYFEPFNRKTTINVSFEVTSKLVMALAASKISRLEKLVLGPWDKLVEWEKNGESSLWVGLWKAIEEHPSLREIDVCVSLDLDKKYWWKPIAGAVEGNSRLVDMRMMSHESCMGRSNPWTYKFYTELEPLLIINRYCFKITAGKKRHLHER